MVFWTAGAQKPAAPRTLEEYPSGLGLGAAFAEGWRRNPAMSLADSTALDIAERGAPTYGFRAPGPRQEPDSALLSAAEANQWFGIPGELTFDHAIPARAARLRYEWKRDELRRRSALARASQSTGAALARMGASFLAQALDPVNLAASFIPVVGEARYARLIQLAGTSAFARGGVRAGVGAVEGAVGAAIVEPLVWQGARVRGEQYDLWDSLANVGYGAALGGGLHSIGGAGADVVRSYLTRRRAGKLTAGEQLVESIGRPTHEAATQGAIAAVSEGRPVRVAEVLAVVDPRTKVPEFRAREDDIAGSIEQFADRAVKTQDNAYLRTGPVPAATIDAARSAGVNLEGFNHVMQGDDIRHTLRRHATDPIPVTPADLARVPDIIATADRVTTAQTGRGAPALVFSKREGNLVTVVEEVRAGKKRLAFKTMYFQRIDDGGSGGPGAIDAPAPDYNPDGTPQSLRPQDQILAREPGTAQSIGDTVREINAPDPAEAEAIQRIEAETAKSLAAPEDLQAEIQRQQELLDEELALLGDDLDAADRAALEQAKDIDRQAREEGAAYEAAAACFIRSGGA